MISSGQIAEGYPRQKRSQSRAQFEPIGGIFSPHEITIRRVSTRFAEASGALRNQDAFIRLRDTLNGGSTSTADWIANIKRIWAHGPANTLELARVIAAAKNTLRHGRWQEVWKALPFSRRKADMLAAIGVRLEWVNWQTFANLPVGWSILYELSKLEQGAFEDLIRSGLIHPGLKLCDAKGLVAQFQGKMGEVKSPSARVHERLRRFERFVHDTLHVWTAAERKLGLETLTQLEEKISLPSAFPFVSNLNVKTTRCHSDALAPAAADSQPDHFNSLHNL